jgi:hypothetical protein
VAGAEDLEFPPTKALDAIQVRPQRPWIWRDKDASFAKNSVACQRRRSGDESEVILGVAGGENRLQRADDTAPGEEHVDLAARCRHGGLSVALA